MKKYFKLFSTIIKNAIIRDNSIFGMVIGNLLLELVEITFTIVFFNIIFSNTESLNGWNFYMMLFLYAYARMVTSISGAISRGGTNDLASTLVRRGDLDFIITKPIDSMTFVLIKRPRPYAFVSAAFFVVLGTYALVKGGLDFSFFGILLILISSIFGIILISLLRLLTVLPVFWFIRLWAIRDAMSKFVQFMRYPADVFPTALRFSLFVLLPVLAASYVPASNLLIEINWLSFGYLVFITFIFAIITRSLWNLGLRKYGSASS